MLVPILGGLQLGVRRLFPWKLGFMFPQDPWDERYISLRLAKMFGKLVSKYTSPMDPIGLVSWFISPIYGTFSQP